MTAFKRISPELTRCMPETDRTRNPVAYTMISAPPPSAGVQMPSNCDKLLEILSTTIGCPFRLWTARTIETPSCESDPGSDRRSLTDSDMICAAERARTHGCSQLDLEDGRLGVWIRLPGNRRRQFIVYGTVPNRELPLVNRLIDAARKLIEQHVILLDQTADMSSCLENLTYGLEEQSWLRALSSHITLCSARRSLRDVATELLPSLRELIRAESIAIVLTKATTVNDGGNSPQLHLMEPAIWHGSKIVEDRFWKEWLDNESKDPQWRPLIQNGVRVNPQWMCHGIQSKCAVQIRRGNVIYGWIVALIRSSYQRGFSSGLPRGLSEAEFGTVEAGLIESAASMLATHGHNVELLQDRENLVIGVIRAMGHAVDARDPYTRGHSERVGRYARQLAEAIGLPRQQCDRIYLSGLLHDVGKIGVPDAVLTKTTRLTEEEFTLIQRHPEIGVRIVQPLNQLSDLLPGILHHHENIDGTGYPHRLKYDEIPLMGRILAVADGYDAMTSDRPYRQGMARKKALEILTSRAGIQWDAKLVRAFVAIPHESLILEAVNSEHGWNSEENWLRNFAEVISSPIMASRETSNDLGQTLPATL